MTDSTRVNDVQEKLLQAMSIVNGKLLETISYDTTITATITDNTDKADGKYILSDGSKTFTAYSSITNYSNNTTVYVTIPNGNWENQKMIIGKKTSDAETPFVFTTPFDNFFALTPNYTEGLPETGLLANDILETQKNAETALENCFSYEKISTISIPEEDEVVDYTRLGIRADFRSWVKDAVTGEYGLAFILHTEKPTLVEDNVNDITPYYFCLKNSDMYGNTYNFESYYSQEIVINLADKDIGQVKSIDVYFYQMADFYNSDGDLLANTVDGWIKYANGGYQRYGDKNHTTDQGYFEWTERTNAYYVGAGDKLSSNLFVENIELYFGEDLSTYESDYIRIYTADASSYKRSVNINETNETANAKNIKVRWVHIDENDSPIDVINGSHDLDYEIRWYRYRVGAAAADEYSSIYWDRIETEEKQTVLDFSPDVNKQQEKIKVIAFCNGVAYRSNELIFANEETVPLDAESYHIMNALMIKVDDGTNGNYTVYGQNDEIKDSTWSKEVRTLSAYFDADNDGVIDFNSDKEKIKDIGFTIKIDKDGNEEKIYNQQSLTWIFPEERSMLKLVNGTDTALTPKEGETTDSLYKNIFEATGDELPQYTIDDSYSAYYSNNTVQCTYVLNGVTYTTEKEFTFGPSGTMGYEETLSIHIVGDNNAVLAEGAEGDTNISFEVTLKDAQGIYQDIPDGTVEWKWYYCYQKDENDTNTKMLIQKLSTQKIDENGDMVYESGTKGNASLSLSESYFDFEHLYILQASVGDLTTYFSVPVRSPEYSYIKGATEVRYQTNGEPSYSKENYTLYEANGTEISDVTWEIFTDNKNSDSELDKKEKLYIGEIYKYESGEKTYYRLNPLPLYVKDALVYGVQAIINKKVVWTQPILVVQNKWPSTTINQWDGKSLQLDEANSSIVAAAIAAGKKNSDNTFSGVMIGDWSGEELDTQKTITEQTGIYGFNKGVMSYALTEDGNAFFGKYGSGRIYIDGDNASLYSSGYQNSNRGMKIDLGTSSSYPFIDMRQGTDNYIKMGFDSSNYPQLRIQNGKGYILLTSQDGQSKISLTGKRETQTGTITLSGVSGEDPLTIGTKFSVGWDGYLTTTDGKFKGTVNAESGYLNDLDISGDLTVYLGTSRTGPIYFRNTATNNTLYGYIGYIEGATANSATRNIGIVTQNYTGIVLNSNTNFRATAKEDLYLDSSKISFINGDHTANSYVFTYSYQRTSEYTNLGISPADRTAAVLYTNIPAGNQFGIYARFA